MTIPEKIRTKVVDYFIEIHRSMDDYVSRFFKLHKRKIYITPKLYEDSLKIYKQILDKKSNEISVRMEQLTGGGKINLIENEGKKNLKLNCSF